PSQMGNLLSPRQVVNITGRDCVNSDYLNDYCMTDAEYIAEIRYELRPTVFEVCILLMYLAVFVVGLVGNALVVAAVLRTSQMRSATNLFLLNLALADFLVILLCLVPTVIEDIMETWVFGDLACRVLKYLQPVSVAVSVLTLTFNSVERLLAICLPMWVKATKKRIVSLILLIWTVAMATKVHYPLKMRAVHYSGLPQGEVLLTQCKSSWEVNMTAIAIAAAASASNSTQTDSFPMSPTQSFDMIGNIVDSVVFFILPFAWMLIAYAVICRRLWHAAVPGESLRRSASDRRSVSGSVVNSTASAGAGGGGASNRRKLDATLKQRRRTALMLIAIVVIFFVCYLPVHVLRA
uniref:G_PROTEIN_RECEP_F1_2 domain-containing protein n=1 Tax=Macrostomum lignano TaxID=282301 RepID=A0A1I8GXP0_9PLAT